MFLQTLEYSLNNSTNKPFKKIAELDTEREYKITKLNTLVTKYGRKVVTEFDNFKIFMPSRHSEQLMEHVDKINEDIMEENDLFLVRKNKQGQFEEIELKARIKNKKRSHSTAFSNSSDEEDDRSVRKTLRPQKEKQGKERLRILKLSASVKPEFSRNHFSKSMKLVWCMGVWYK